MDLGLSGLVFIQYKEGSIYRIMFPKFVSQDGSTHNYIHRYAVFKDKAKEPLYYEIFTTEVASANLNELQKALVATRKLVTLLGSNEYSGVIGSNEVPVLLGEEIDDTDVLRYSIADYAYNRFERRFEESFLLWEFVSAIKGNAEEIFRQLKYFDMHGVLTFSPPLDRFAPKPKFIDVLAHQIILNVESKSELSRIITEKIKGQNQKSFDLLLEMTKQMKNPVFIVHGRDEQIANAIREFVESLGIEAIILKEQPNKGLTLIEKLEDNLNVGYAIVILSADDEGRLRGDAEFKFRARQNVILELGLFMGKIGRNKVASILPEPTNFEKPSDIDGLVYIPFDGSNNWKIQLKKELIAAGFGNGPSIPVRRI